MDETSDQAASGSTTERLRGFLRTLSPTVCAQLLDTMEKAALAGEPVPGAEMILDELRTILREAAKRKPRSGTPVRHFFRIAEALLIDEELPEKRPARIERASLPPIWTWIKRNLIPEEASAFEASCSAAILLEDMEQVRALVHEFHKTAAAAIKTALAAMSSEAERRRQISQIGGPRVFDDLRDLLVMLENRDAFRALNDRVVGPIRAIDDAQMALIIGALQPFTRASSQALLVYAGAVVMSKLVQPWQILRVVVSACETDEADTIAASAYSHIVELVLTDVERLVIRAANARRTLDVAKVFSAARDFSSYVKALSSDINLNEHPTWARRLGVWRGRMGELLRTQIETLPGRVRWLLKPVAQAKAQKGDVADAQEIASIEVALDILMLARNHAAELALNEVTMRVFGDLQAMLDSGINPLIESLRSTSGDDRIRRLTQLEAAVRIAGKVFGSNYAGLLQKAIDVAAGGDRKSGKAA
ncbi:MAG: hypothetical protein ACK50Q_11085 [Labrys sp. (in: a-proteobacteria)]